MKKNNILYILVAFLIVVNGFFLFNYMSKSDGNTLNEPKGNRDFIVKELGFNKAQLAEFKANSKDHHKTMMRLSDEIKDLKDELFSKLSDDSINEPTIDSISSLISEKEKIKDKEVFYHFKMIQELSNDKQKEKFKTIIMDALRKGEQGQRPPRHGEGKGHRPPSRNS